MENKIKKPDLNKPIFRFYKREKELIQRNKCPRCEAPITGFKDQISETEYSISGLCQKCQDKTF